MIAYYRNNCISPVQIGPFYTRFNYRLYSAYVYEYMFNTWPNYNLFKIKLVKTFVRISCWHSVMITSFRIRWAIRGNQVEQIRTSIIVFPFNLQFINKVQNAVRTLL